MQGIVCPLFLSIQRPALFICHLKYVCLAAITSSILTLCSDALHLLSAAAKKFQRAVEMCVCVMTSVFVLEPRALLKLDPL